MLLQGPGTLPFWRDIKEGEPIGAEQPFVDRKHQEIGLQLGDIERHHARGLCRIDQHASFASMQFRHDTRKIDEAAVGPVQRGERCKADGRRARGIDALEHGRRPIAIFRARHDIEMRAARACEPGKRKMERGVLALEQQHARSSREPKIGEGRRDAVARRADDGDVVSARADETRRFRARRLHGQMGSLRTAPPRPHLLGDALLAGRLHRAREGRVGGGVEIGNLALDREERALAAQHAVALSCNRCAGKDEHPR